MSGEAKGCHVVGGSGRGGVELPYVPDSSRSERVVVQHIVKISTRSATTTTPIEASAAVLFLIEWRNSRIRGWFSSSAVKSGYEVSFDRIREREPNRLGPSVDRSILPALSAWRISYFKAVPGHGKELHDVGTRRGRSSMSRGQVCAGHRAGEPDTYRAPSGRGASVAEPLQRF